MKKLIQHLCTLALLFPISSIAWQWTDLWRTADQQGAELLKAGKANEAASVFKNKNWQNVALYRAGKFEKAFNQFNQQKTSDSQYNAGNAAAHIGRYQEAIHAYDKAIALDPHNKDAITNREIVKKLLEKQNKQNSSSANNEKKNSENKPSNNPSQSSDQEKQAQAGQQNKDNKTAKNEPQKNSAQNTQHPQEQSQSTQPSPQNNAANSKQEMQPTSAPNQWQAQEENQNQLLRRVPDDPGGLLRQKFLRDYMRRHGTDMDQGG